MKKVPTQVQHVAVSFADGSVAIMQFLTLGRGNVLPPGAEWFSTPELQAWTRKATHALVEGEVRKTFSNEGRKLASPAEAFPAVTGWRLIDAPPADRSYRDAWTDQGDRIGHDMGKARAIHRDKLRAARAPLLAALDVDYAKADEAGNQAEKRRVAAEKQRLRDITADPRIDAAATIDELKGVIP
jgi:hypothetical protein